MNNYNQESTPRSFATKIREEYETYRPKKPMDTEQQRRELELDRQHRLAIDCRVAAVLGRKITDKEFLTANI